MRTAVVVILCLARIASAEEDISPARRAAAVATAIGPGALVHGAGSYVARENRPALKLAIAEGAGIVMMAVAGGFVGGTGGNAYVIVPGVPILIAGTGLFLQSWLTDIYVAAGGARFERGPRAAAPFLIEVGTTWQYAAYHERALARARGEVALGPISVAADASLGSDAKLARLDVRGRVWREVTVRVGSRLFRDDDDNVTQWTSELEVGARVDLAPIDEMFDGTFVELSTGIAAARVTYARTTHEWDSLLLGRFAWGAYLGRSGEALLYYDHRRDGLAGGIAASRAAGFIGSFGGIVEHRVIGPWNARAELQIGNAWLTTIGVVYRSP